jgi:hypothetical protein
VHPTSLLFSRSYGEGTTSYLVYPQGNQAGLHAGTALARVRKPIGPFRQVIKTLRRAKPSIGSKALMFPPNMEEKHMSRLGNADGLSIIARYTSVIAIAVTSTAGSLPRNVSDDDLRSDQVTCEQQNEQRVEGVKSEK